MNFSDYLKLAFTALTGNKLRSILTLLIIAFGIMALIIIFTCITAIKGNITENFVELGAGAFTIQKDDGLGRRNRWMQDDLPKVSYDDVVRFKEKYNYPSKIAIHCKVNGDAVIKSNIKESNPNVSIESGDINYLSVSGKSIMKGRGFSPMEMEQGSSVAIMGYDAAAKVYEDADSVVGSYLLADGKRFLVVGLLESKGASAGKNDNFVLIPYTNARKEFDLSKASYEIIVEAKDPESLDQAIAEAEGTMRLVKKLGAIDENNFSIVRSDKLATEYLKNIWFIEIATGVIGFLTLIGAGVGLMNIMLVSVNERTREIGLSKSIGANSNTIFMQFLLEAITICLSGGLIGIFIGIILGNLISVFVLQAKFTLAKGWVMGGILFCTLIGLLAGLLPAIRASKLNPVEALRHE